MQQVEHNWQEYRTRLVRFVRSKVHNDVIAEDIVHDALVKAWTKRSTLRDESMLLPWLFQITMNAVRDHHRVRHHDVLSDIDPVDQPTSEDLHHIAVCLTSMIATLEEPYRSAVHRSEIDGVPMRVIADELNISLSGVKSRVQRGKAKLKEQVMACCQFEVNRRGQITNGDEHHCTNPDCGCQAA
ncbi:MAG: sigma-70 family RNA polymerase sigma factor [Candidatus Kapabacteria bacterium]|nr:sigma-70 family RNA polymerase sigma factor [Candidatus Kapabacteria bacterium]MBP7094019.1 sigma-70 family RNA polymerase sigma factor [Candidatus Kapabacteria bacterium]